jgi:hypothetical protein
VTSHQHTYEALVASLCIRIKEDVRAQALVARTTPETMLHAVVTSLVGEELRGDGRQREWRVRLRLFDYAHGLYEPVADSDANLPADAPGETSIRSLPAVVRWIGQEASEFHEAPCVGLEAAVLGRKIGGLRTQISNRGDSSGTIRANYTVTHYGNVRHMIARCDIEKVQKEDDYTVMHHRRP